MSLVHDLEPYVQHCRARFLQDMLTEATSAYWTRRAEAFDAARSRPGDYPGRTTAEQRAARDRRLATVAQACRHRAEVSLLQTTIELEVLDALNEVA